MHEPQHASSMHPPQETQSMLELCLANLATNMQQCPSLERLSEELVLILFDMVVEKGKLTPKVLQAGLHLLRFSEICCMRLSAACVLTPLSPRDTSVSMRLNVLLTSTCTTTLCSASTLPPQDLTASLGLTGPRLIRIQHYTGVHPTIKGRMRTNLAKLHSAAHCLLRVRALF
jgi:hypothetical protein